jgi:flagellar hook-associated protein 2
LTHGNNLLYTINNGPTLVSQSNTIDSSSSGITGLSVTALTTGTTNVTVSTDTSSITTAVQNFVNAYNTVQGYLTTQSASSTDSTGAVTAGVLTGDQAAAELASNLRNNSLTSVSVAGLSQTFSNLAGLGVKSNGYDNTITLDTTVLASALSTNLSDVKKLFSDSTNGLAVKLNTYLNNTIGDAGTIPNHQTALTTQSNSINTQIANLEKQITSDSNYWTTEFQAMETATAASNQTLSYLTQSVTNGTL